MNRQRLLDILKLAIGIALILFLITRLEDPAALWQQILDANKGLLLLGACFYAGAVAMSAIKWGVLLRATDIVIPWRRLLSWQWQAEFFNNFLPAQVGGDVARGYALATDTHRTADAAASVVIDRFMGLLVFMLCAAVATSAMLLFGRPDGTMVTGDQLTYMRWIAAGSGIISAGLLVAMAILLSRRLKVQFERLLARLPLSARTVPIWQKAARAFDAYRDHAVVLLWVALGSALIVLMTSINIWLIARAIEPGGISLIEVLAINPIIVFVALALPLSPGGLGVRQSAFVLTFLLVGASGQLGLIVGLLQQALGYLVSIPGGFFWIRGGRRQSSPESLVLDELAHAESHPQATNDAAALQELSSAIEPGTAESKQ